MCLLSFLVFTLNRVKILHVTTQDMIDPNSGKNAHHRSKNQHKTDLGEYDTIKNCRFNKNSLGNPESSFKKTYHDSSKIHARDTVHDDEDVVVGKLFETDIESN